MCLTNQNFPLLVTNSVRIMRNIHFPTTHGRVPFCFTLFCFFLSAETLACLGMSKIRKIPPWFYRYFYTHTSKDQEIQ